MEPVTIALTWSLVFVGSNNGLNSIPMPNQQMCMEIQQVVGKKSACWAKPSIEMVTVTGAGVGSQGLGQ